MDNYLPPEWNDEERMRVLMSNMPDVKEMTAYNGRLTFWTVNLHNWIRCKEGISFSIQDAQMAFRKGTQVPQCFPQVLQHMIRQGEIISYEELNKHASDSESWMSWSKRVFVSTPSRWAWNRVQSTVGNKTFENTVFVDWIVLQEMSDKILSEYFFSINESDNCMHTVDSLFKISKSVIPKLNLDDLDLILHFLVREGKAVTLTQEDTTYIKLLRLGKTEIPRITCGEIAEQKLISTEKSLKLRMETIQEDISPLKEQAKAAILSGSKKQALIILKRKKRLEKSLETALSAHENILTCLQQLQDSKLNSEVLEAFQLGFDALKESIKATGPPEEVSSKMDSLQDVLDECNDISQSLSSGIRIAGVDDDDESLEKELCDLLSSSQLHDNPSRVESEGDTFLPAVPTFDPSLLLEKSVDKSKEITLT